MKKLFISLPLVMLTACALTPSQQALQDVNRSQAKVAALTAAKAKTSAELVKANKELKENKEKFESIYVKGE